jgi:N-acyl amino acid synthase of PEP-CTERM/exosortase system
MALLFRNCAEIHKMTSIDLVSPYREYFKIVPADTAELRDEVYRLRFEVYCEDLDWEDAAQFPEGKERDTFDDRAAHCLLLHRRSGQYAGTIRLVKTVADSPEPCIPILQHYDRSLFHPDASPVNLARGSFGEISRLALRKQFRRRQGEDETPDGHGASLFEWTPGERRRFPHVALGLYLAAATVGLAEGMEGVFAMMEPRLARHLRFGGIYFKQVGGAVDHRGCRAPFYISRELLFAHLTPPLMRLLETIAEDLSVSIDTQAFA